MSRAAGGTRWRIADISNPVLASGIVISAAICVTLFSYLITIDDAYISYRYALNLVRGHGLVFNPGEYVEGYTNLLWTLLMVIPLWVGLPVELSAAIVGLICGVLAVLNTWRLLLYLEFPDLVIWIALLVCSAFVHFWIVAVNGLEGGLVALLLACALYQAIRFERPYLLGIYGGLLFMTRPDTLAVVPVLLLYQLASKTPRRSILVALASWLTLLCTVTIWRLAYYQAILPNTVFAKSPSANLFIIRHNIELGLIYIKDFLLAFPYFLGCLILAALVMWRSRLLFSLMILMGIQFAVVIRNGGDWMPNYRLLSAYEPLIMIIVACVTNHILKSKLIPNLQATRGVLIAGMIFSFIITSRTNIWERRPEFDLTTSICYQQIATRIQPALLESDKIAPDALGHIGYLLSNTYFHDMWGLTDRHIATEGRYEGNLGKVDREYSLYTIKPTIIIVHETDWHLVELSRVSHGDFNKQYRSYDLKSLSEMTGCQAKMMMSIRTDSVDRMLPKIYDLQPKAMLDLH